MPFIDLAFLLFDAVVVWACIWYLPRYPSQAYLFQGIAALFAGNLTKAAIWSVLPGSPIAYVAWGVGMVLCLVAFRMHSRRSTHRTAESGADAQPL